jgi:xanthine dehydrogenase molybdenum-binding subunit
MRPGAVIDIKRIPQCLEIGTESGVLSLGSGLTLNDIVDAGNFPLLSQVAGSVADHTTRNRITLGGNIAGHLPYRESILPMLVADAEVQIAGPEGKRSQSVGSSYDKNIRLDRGEFLVCFKIEEHMTKAPFLFIRRESFSRVDYPLISSCFLKSQDGLRMAVSGAFYYPLRSREADMALNDSLVTHDKRPGMVVEKTSARLRDDFRASSEYRRMLLEIAIEEAILKLE